MLAGRVLTSQTIGVEFASKIIKIGTGPRRRRVKLQLWDTAGTERFRAVSRSYYRGAAGAILVYDVGSRASWSALPTFLLDARALASPGLTVLLAGNKSDLWSDTATVDGSHERDHDNDGASSRSVDTTTTQTTVTADDYPHASAAPSSVSSHQTVFRVPPSPDIPASASASVSNFSSTFSLQSSSASPNRPHTKLTATRRPPNHAPDDYADGVSLDEASAWAARNNISVATEVSALTGDGVDELFSRLARIILTRIELGEIDPDDPQSGIQYGDVDIDGGWARSEAGSVRSSVNVSGADSSLRWRGGRRRGGGGGWSSSMREWEDVFWPSTGRRRSGCC